MMENMGVSGHINRPHKITGGIENERIYLQVIRRTAAVFECGDGGEIIGNLSLIQLRADARKRLPSFESWKPAGGAQGEIPAMGGRKGDRMRQKNFGNRRPSGKFFPLPNALFRLDLLPGEIAVYAYLMYREDRETYQCHPSYATIGKAINMSPNTVRKYVRSLEEKYLIYTEPTTIITKKGEKRNGSLLYTIRPIQDAVNHKHKLEWEKIEREFARQELKKRQVS